MCQIKHSTMNRRLYIYDEIIFTFLFRLRSFHYFHPKIKRIMLSSIIRVVVQTDLKRVDHIYWKAIKFLFFDILHSSENRNEIHASMPQVSRTMNKVLKEWIGCRSHAIFKSTISDYFEWFFVSMNLNQLLWNLTTLESEFNSTLKQMVRSNQPLRL